jgi:hypothetical protein
MSAYIKRIASIFAVTLSAFAILGFVNSGYDKNVGSEEQPIDGFTSITFENISLTNTYDVIVDGEVVGNIGPRRSIDIEIITGSHSIVYRNADSGEIASGDRTVTVNENEHLTVYCSYDG